jgi:hypothetical protein
VVVLLQHRRGALCGELSNFAMSFILYYYSSHIEIEKKILVFPKPRSCVVVVQ